MAATDVLALPSFRAADVTLLAGDPDSVTVRWVHSSEVFEMGSLLDGGELLLTTGLGLHGRDANQLEAYVDQLADAGCVGLVVELGRSLLEVPAPIVQAARRRHLLLFHLTNVVPFERMIEDFHDLVLRTTLEAARDGDGEAIWPALLDVVVAGQGLRPLLDTISRMAGCQVELHDPAGRVVEQSRIASTRSGRTAVEVSGGLGPRGTLLLHTPPSDRVNALAERAATAVALELARHPDTGLRPSLTQALISDLANRLLVSRGEVIRRLSQAGITLSEGQHLLVACVDAGHRVEAGELVSAVEAAWSTDFDRVAVGAIGQQVVVLSPQWQGTPPLRIRDTLERAAHRLTLPEGLPLVGVATPASDPAELGEGVEQARDTVRLAHGYGVHSGVWLARDLGVQRLLGRGVPADELAAFIAEQLGPVIEHDRAHSSDLVRTVDAYLSSGHSKAASAARLGIRRQSLYARLERIERLLGISLADPTQVGGLTLALTAWRLRTGVDPQTAFGRRTRRVADRAGGIPGRDSEPTGETEGGPKRT